MTSTFTGSIPARSARETATRSPTTVRLKRRARGPSPWAWTSPARPTRPSTSRRLTCARRASRGILGRVVQPHHPHPIAGQVGVGGPGFDLVVVQFGEGRRVGDRLAVLVDLGLPAVGGHRRDPLGPVHHHQAVVEGARPGPRPAPPPPRALRPGGAPPRRPPRAGRRTAAAPRRPPRAGAAPPRSGSRPPPAAGARPGSPPPGSPSSAASAARRPPVVTAARSRPSRPAASAADRVSSVSPLWETITTRGRACPAHPGRP